MLFTEAQHPSLVPMGLVDQPIHPFPVSSTNCTDHQGLMITMTLYFTSYARAQKRTCSHLREVNILISFLLPLQKLGSPPA